MAPGGGRGLPHTWLGTSCAQALLLSRLPRGRAGLGGQQGCALFILHKQKGRGSSQESKTCLEWETDLVHWLHVDIYTGTGSRE